MIRRTPIERMVDSVMSCTLCGAKGVGTCDCWVTCSCGWHFEKGTECRNEVHRCPRLVRKLRCIEVVGHPGRCWPGVGRRDKANT
jgi:hypothetical protein